MAMKRHYRLDLIMALWNSRSRSPKFQIFSKYFFRFLFSIFPVLVTQYKGPQRFLPESDAERSVAEGFLWRYLFPPNLFFGDKNWIWPNVARTAPGVAWGHENQENSAQLALWSKCQQVQGKNSSIFKTIAASSNLIFAIDSADKSRLEFKSQIWAI